jgi:hypothetical protein
MRYKIEVDRNFREGYVESEKLLFDKVVSGSDVKIGPRNGSTHDVDVKNARWLNNRMEWEFELQNGEEINIDKQDIYFTTNQPVETGRYKNLEVSEVASGGKRRKRVRKTNYKKSRSRKRFSRKQYK